MRSTVIASLALVAASPMLAACSSGGSAPPLGGTVGSVQAVQSQSCSGGYAECITLSFGSPFEQQWCVLPPAGLRAHVGFIDCKKYLKSGTWNWLMKVHSVRTGHRFQGIDFAFKPNPGNPTEMTMSENKRIKSSGGKIAYVAFVLTCSPFSGGQYCPESVSIGIATK